MMLTCFHQWSWDFGNSNITAEILGNKAEVKHATVRVIDGVELDESCRTVIIQKLFLN